MSARPALRRIGSLPLSRVLETAFVILAIYILTNARLPLGSSSPRTDVAPVDPTSAEAGSPLNYAILSVMFLVSFVLAAKRPRALWRATTADLLLTALLVLTLASVLWSDVPDVTFRRWVALLGTTIFGVYLHLRYTMEEQLRLVSWALGATVVYSLLMISPSALTEGGFAGAFENKNSLGRIMALSTIVFALLASIRRPRGPAVVFAGLSFVLVLLAGSSTGLLVTLTVLSLTPLLRLLSRDMRLAVGLGGIAILVLGVGLLLVASNLGAATAAVGRDPTLTGRTDLWQYVIVMILQRPWLGYGYETFWLWELPWRFSVDEGAGWTAPNAHNGFLEVALALGVVGLVLFVIGLVRGLVRAVKYLQGEPGRIGSWPAMYLCYALLYNLTEIGALARNTLIWVLYVSALLAVSSKKREAAVPPGRARARRFPVSAASVGPARDLYTQGTLTEDHQYGKPL
jgi:exopolysaccharide production protein ExoQ